MISIQEAMNCSLEKTKVSQLSEIRLLSKSLGYRLSQNIYSTIDMPPFEQSAMDGYALRLHSSLSYKIIGEHKAGDGGESSLEPGEALRIFTGASVPKQAEAIVIQERVKRENNHIHLETPSLKGANIRPKGEQIKAGDLALEKGKILNPAAIGYLASLGISEIEVFSKPKIGILSTGNELVAVGEDLPKGKIYESNGLMLQSALQSNEVFDVQLYKVHDDLKSTKDVIKKALIECDYLLISGGISVGDYDFVERALATNKVDCHFYKVAQKPGKPLWFGSKENKIIFALPGNPAAALSCFYVYVLPSIKKWMGYANFRISWKEAELSKDFSKKGIRPQFLKAKLEDQEITILEGQNSSMLHTFAHANALCFLDGEREYSLLKGEKVNYISLSSCH